MVSALFLLYIGSPCLGYTIKTKLYIISDCRYRDMLNFGFIEKSLWQVLPLNFVYDFSRKVFLMLYSFNWPNFIVWLPLLIEILGNKRVITICSLNYDVLNLELTLV